MRYQSLKTAIVDCEEGVKRFGEWVHTETWQGADISKRPEARMKESLHINIEAPMPTEDLDYYRDQIKPNLPFADKAFDERVSGFPMNPGEAWKSWPWAHSADKHRIEDKFEHTYQERYWPKTAGAFVDETNVGIRFPYGDLKDMLRQLAEEPLTRQAYLPVFFPEDTGYRGRKPCTLGYFFIMRNNRLDITYYIRSCDLYRHFRDDIYLTVRLLLWVLGECRTINYDVWPYVTPGLFRMDIGSLHCFVNDLPLI